MKHRKTRLLAWALCGIIIVSASLSAAAGLTDRPPDENVFKVAEDATFVLIPVVFAIVAALIVSRQPRNVIGWLLMTPALAFAIPTGIYLKGFSTAPVAPTFTLLLALWFASWNWLLLIFPIFFIPLLFPTGRPPSPRWRWLIAIGLGMCVTLIFFATFAANFGPGDAAWNVPNPIGFLPEDAFPMTLWGVFLLTLTVACAASLFVRYRRAAALEREQIKWLLYACGLFVAVYVPGWWISDLTTVVHGMWDVLFSLAILAIPVAIAIAILRYRLWDIDIIIRRTLVYSVLTGMLALTYFGMVVLLQQAFDALTGAQSPLAVVLSTLAIAALFSPLRRRVQDGIDRRFYRKKYDAAKALEAFAASVRDETDLESLKAHLVGVVQETMQPEQVSLWLRESGKSSRS